ncbi:hypothetical protein P167DRAFT_540996 [Morchella conica CCBAS932]|uniref:Uncharacterized protein n=1 Tax=Morchella conica CCBAS932 TaxID=1392247 RepID=A0A3N4L456_9PEZI|nr:hypothetical protein P167DRAFT_540996 [Morchella conica CCBAS932]
MYVHSMAAYYNLQYKYRASPFMPTSRFVQQDVEYPNRLKASTHTLATLLRIFLCMPHLDAGCWENSLHEQKPTHITLLYSITSIFRTSLFWDLIAEPETHTPGPPYKQ